MSIDCSSFLIQKQGEIMMKQRFVQGNLSKTFGKNSNGAIKYIVIHETDNTAPKATADAHSRLQKNNPREASWHYQVDRVEAIQSYTHDVACWHSGKGNRGSIAIELCVDGGFNTTAFNNMIDLIVQLKKQYPKAKLVQHNYFTGKHCPRNIRDKRLWAKVERLEKFSAAPSKNEAHNVPSKDVSKDTVSVRLQSDQNGYMTAQDALQGKSPKTTLKAGDYFVFKESGGATNLSTKKGVAGSWVVMGKPTIAMDTAKPTLKGRALKLGDRGQDVLELQRALISKHFYPNKRLTNLGADGIFGKDTQNAVRRFQSVYLPREVDGIAGPNTKKKLGLS